MTFTLELSHLIELHGTQLTSSDLYSYSNTVNVSYQTLVKNLAQYKVGRGQWNLEVTEDAVQQLEKTYEAPAVKTNTVEKFIPKKDDTFVSFGSFGDIKKIISSRIFYPVFITGLSGNGKTFGVEQACAQLSRELIRVNITIETDEDDLIGGFRLVNGETVWHNGPVVEALERGAVLLLDEIDLASNKILCLQSVLEGKGVFLKKIGRYVRPEHGFTVVATANTKGKGSDDGRFIGTNILNEAFLERFPITFEQEYPSAAIEKRILKNVSQELDCYDEDFCDKLTAWSDIIRKTFFDGGVDEIISTRRLVHIIRAFSIFSDRKKAIELCINRFDDETKQSFIELYGKLDVKVNASDENFTGNVDGVDVVTGQADY